MPPELRERIREFKAELMELAPLAHLYGDVPAWPPASGRSGPLSDWPFVIGDAVRISDGREGILKAIIFDTRSGHMRSRVELSDGTAVLLDPEDVRAAVRAPQAAGKGGAA